MEGGANIPKGCPHQQMTTNILWTFQITPCSALSWFQGPLTRLVVPLRLASAFSPLVKEDTW
jgi:hypothetical protein